VYIINPVGGENVTPWVPGSTYADGQYNTEFASAVPNPSPNTLSVSTVAGIQGPSYKWVRINAISENSLNLDVDSDGIRDNKELYYDSVSSKLTTSASGTAQQVFEITSFAVLPNGSQKMLQYLATPTPITLPPFLAAVTLDGSTAQFKAPPSPSFWVLGNDQGSVGTCNPNPAPFIAVGYTTGTLANFLQPTNPAGVPVGLQDHYTNGVPASNPDIVQVTLSPNLQTVAGLNALVQTIQQNADVVVNGNATQANFPAGMSPTNPMTIVINGDLTISGWRSTGYGLLLVTGKFTYDPDASWDGIVLVIGKGLIDSHQGAHTATQILGAVFVATTVDSSGNPLSSLGSPNFDFTYSPATNPFGISYSSCWIQAAMPSPGYKILSFHEISQ
jgi:hypothetical protein